MTEQSRVPADVVAAVALGGALGAAARYGVATVCPTAAGQLPWATLTVNLIGSALLGGLMRAISRRIAPHRLVRPFLGTGVLGGFTTFSAYALETRALLVAGRPVLALGYTLGTLAGALAAVALGGWVIDRVLR